MWCHAIWLDSNEPFSIVVGAQNELENRHAVSFCIDEFIRLRLPNRHSSEFSKRNLQSTK